MNPNHAQIMQKTSPNKPENDRTCIEVNAQKLDFVQCDKKVLTTIQFVKRENVSRIKAWACILGSVATVLQHVTRIKKAALLNQRRLLNPKLANCKQVSRISHT